MSDAALPALGATAAPAQPVAARRKRRPPGTSLTRTVLIWAVAIIWLLPVVWIFATAFKAPRDVLSLHILFAPTLHNFTVAFGNPFFLGEQLMNSAIVTVATLVIALPISTAAAYAFSRFRFPGGAIWPLGVLATADVQASRITARGDRHLRLAIGEQVGMRISRDHLFLFDAKTEARIRR